MNVPEEPRSLHAAEKAVVLALLGHADFEGRDELLAGVDRARVVGRCDCGCPSVTLDGADRPAAGASAAQPIPNEATFSGRDDESAGGVLLFAAGGRLAELEVYSFGEEPIRTLPTPELLRLERAPQ